MQHSRIIGGNKGFHNDGPSSPERDARRVVVWHRLAYRLDLPEENGLRARTLLGVPANRAVCTAISTGYTADRQVRQLGRAPVDVGAAVLLGRTPIEELVICGRYARRERPSAPADAQVLLRHTRASVLLQRHLRTVGRGLLVAPPAYFVE